MEAFEVELDGHVHRFFPGSTVRDLIGRLDEEERRAIANDRAFVSDSLGNRLGDSGALKAGGRYVLVRTN